jgi:hypothetical protein
MRLKLLFEPKEKHQTIVTPKWVNMPEWRYDKNQNKNYPGQPSGIFKLLYKKCDFFFWKRGGSISSEWWLDQNILDWWGNMIRSL